MRNVIAVCLTLCLSAALALPASALNYTIDAPGGPDYGTPTSVEVIHTADGGVLKNEDISKCRSGTALFWQSQRGYAWNRHLSHP